jgi:hypothetical protein
LRAGVIAAGLFGIGVVDKRLAGGDAIAVQVADRDDLGMVVFESLEHVVDARDASDADGGDRDAIAGRVLAEDAGGHDCRRGRSRDTGLQDIAAGQCFAVGHVALPKVGGRFGPIIFKSSP